MTENEKRSAKETISSPVEHPAFNQFVATIAALRAPDGCPWDKEQTHRSIAHNMIEEAYESVDAIEHDDVTHLREELGDVLLQVVLQSQIAEDAGEFTIDDVCADVNAKMIRRHPHVFGEESAANANEVLDLWEQVKLAEKSLEDAQAESANEQAKSLLDSVPSGFPALMQAQKISKKAVAVGFEWESVDDVWAKVREEEAELQEAYAAAAKTANGKIVADTPEAAHVEDELGDVLFTMVNVGRKMGVNSENALRSTCLKFRKRWELMEKYARENDTPIDTLSIDELEELWKRAKNDLA